jgi:hypothetical protein
LREIQAVTVPLLKEASAMVGRKCVRMGFSDAEFHPSKRERLAGDPELPKLKI